MDTKVFNTGLHEFEQLLHDKQFLLVMLHSMEDNPNFSVRDRRNVASMLTIALFNSMPYLTEVLFDLLRELINRSMSRNTPKLLFTGYVESCNIFGNPVAKTQNIIAQKLSFDV